MYVARLVSTRRHRVFSFPSVRLQGTAAIGQLARGWLRGPEQRKVYEQTGG